MDKVDQYIEALFCREGGFTDNALDKGRATKYGITASTLAHFRGVGSVTTADVALLGRDEARFIYRRQYFDHYHLDLLPDEIEEQVFDIGVNSGPGIAIQMLQEILGVKADGVVGPGTVAAATLACQRDARILNNQLAGKRLMLYARICRRDPSQIVFLQGWIVRALGFVR